MHANALPRPTAGPDVRVCGGDGPHYCARLVRGDDWFGPLGVVICCRDHMLLHRRRLSFDPASRDIEANLQRRRSPIAWVAFQMVSTDGARSVCLHFARFAFIQDTGYTAVFHQGNLEAMPIPGCGARGGPRCQRCPRTWTFLESRRAPRIASDCGRLVNLGALFGLARMSTTCPDASLGQAVDSQASCSAGGATLRHSGTQERLRHSDTQTHRQFLSR